MGTIVVAFLGGRVLAATTPPTTMPTTRVNYQRYEVLSEHNIFLRDRHHVVARAPSNRPAFATPEQAFVLTGIVFEDGEFHAYLEDLAGGTSMKLRIGDSIARGQISDIEMDSIQYQGAGTSAWVEIGNNLTGGEVESVSEARIQAAAAGGISSTQPSATMPANVANLSVEERMRLRRLQGLSH